MKLTSRLFLGGVLISCLALYGVLQTHLAHEEHAIVHSRDSLKYALAGVAPNHYSRNSSVVGPQRESIGTMDKAYPAISDEVEIFLKAKNATLVQDRLRVEMLRLLPLANLSSLESAVVCQGPEENRSCVFRNMYWYHSQYWLFVVGASKIPDRRISFASKYGPFVQVPVKSFKTPSELQDFLVKGKFITWSRLTLIFTIMWHHNVGHALFDGLWPAFVALLKFNLHTFPFRALIDIDVAHERTRYLIEEILDVFCGDRVEKLYALQRTDHNIRFDLAVAGSKSMGQRHMNAEVSLPGGRELDASRLFRNRMYAMHDLSMKRTQETIGIIIQNRRFSMEEEVMLRSINNIDGMLFEYIDWSKMKTFKAQLQKILTVGVHVSSIGTGQMYQTFLPNGAVHVNLGTISYERQALVPWFMEQYMAEGAPYIRALYYNSSKRLCGLYVPEVDSLLRQAVRLHRAGFPLPVPPGENLSPEGRIFRELCSHGKCKDLLESMNPTRATVHPGICARDAWAEYVIYEQGGWSTSGWKENGVVGYCPLDRQALHNLRRKYDLAPVVLHGGKVDCVDGSISQIHQPRADRLQCHCSHDASQYAHLLKWDLIKSGKVCFEISVLESHGEEFFFVEDELATFPHNSVLAKKHPESVSTFRIVKALNAGHQSGFALESCKHKGYYMRHMNGRVIISRPSSATDPDAGWFFGPPERPIASVDTCGVIGASYNEEMFIDIVKDVTAEAVLLERAKGTCLEFRVPLEDSVPPPLVKHDSDTHDVDYEKQIGTLPAGITKKIIQEGQGRKHPRIGDKVSVHYVCTLAATGKPIDSSRDRNHIFSFTLGRGDVISGWDFGVSTMRKGEHASLTLPSEFAYGAQGNYPDIPSGATLVFDIEVLDWTSNDPFHCHCSHSPTLLSWKDAHSECFHVLVNGSSPLYLSVNSEGETYPANEVFGQMNTLHAVSLKVVSALDTGQHARGAFSLQSCKNPEHYLRHSNGRVLLSPSSSLVDRDTGWLSVDFHESDTCGMLRPFVDDALAFKLTIDSAQLEKQSGTCMQWLRKNQ